MKGKGLFVFLALGTLALTGKANALSSAKADSLIESRIQYYVGSHYYSNRNYFGLSGNQYKLRFSIENGDSVSLTKDAIGFSYTLSPADSTDLYGNDILETTIDTTETDQEILNQADGFLRRNIQGANGIPGNPNQIAKTKKTTFKTIKRGNFLELFINSVKSGYATIRRYNISGQCEGEIYSGNIKEGENKINIPQRHYSQGKKFVQMKITDGDIRTSSFMEIR